MTHRIVNTRWPILQPERRGLAVYPWWKRLLRSAWREWRGLCGEPFAWVVAALLLVGGALIAWAESVGAL